MWCFSLYYSVYCYFQPPAHTVLNALHKYATHILTLDFSRNRRKLNNWFSRARVHACAHAYIHKHARHLQSISYERKHLKNTCIKYTINVFNHPSYAEEMRTTFYNICKHARRHLVYNHFYAEDKKMTKNILQHTARTHVVYNPSHIIYNHTERKFEKCNSTIYTRIQALLMP
jgi:hypothetical protein